MGKEQFVALKTNDYSDSTAVVVSTFLPEEADNFLRTLRNAWKGRGDSDLEDIPLAELAIDSGHGTFDAGLVFRNSITGKSQNDLPFDCYDVSTRLSFGHTKNSGRLKHLERIRWSPSSGFTRFHIGVSATRKYFDKNPNANDEDCMRRAVVSPRTENVNFSMRWLDGKFDDWHDGDHGFDENRTSYIRHRGSGSGTCWGTSADVKRMIEGVGRKERLIFATDGKSEENGTGCMIEGYAPVLAFLGNYGSVPGDDAKLIPQMSIPQGISYMLEKVMPAMEKFSKS